MLRVLAVATCVVLAVAGCSLDEGEDAPAEAVVRIETTVTAGGLPVRGAPVTVSAGASLSDLLVLVPGVAFACAGGLCGTADGEAITGPDGRASFETGAGGTRTLLGGRREIAVYATDPQPPPAPALTRGYAGQLFKIAQPRTVLPPLPLWRTRLVVDVVRAQVRFSPIRGAAHGLALTDAQGNSLLTTAAGPGRGSYDPRVLEDQYARVRVTASAKGNGITTEWTSAAYGVQGDRRPPSRGAACRLLSAQGRTALARPCGLTDGRLSTPRPVPELSCDGLPEGAEGDCQRRRDRIDVDLGRERSVSLIVVRGVRRSPELSTSTDGLNFRPVVLPRDAEVRGDIGDRGTVVVPLDPRRVRYVRVTGDETTITELSAW